MKLGGDTLYIGPSTKVGIHGNEVHDPDFLATDGSNSPTADISWGNNRITDLSNPIDPQDAATKDYVDTQDAGKANADLSNVSDSTVLDKIKNVDGSGSGLDADLLDGKEASDFMEKATYDTDNDGVVESADYAATAGDADTLDGQHASEFAPATHASNHQVGGSDQLDLRGLSGGWLTADIEANRPAAGTKDRYFYATDTGKLYYDDGTTWVEITPTPASHASSHQPGGSDSLPTAAPSDITEGAMASEGSSTSFARADHVHGTPSEWTPKAHASSHQPGGSDALPTAAPSDITEGATASEGTSTSFARADHVHGTPSEWTPKVHGNEAHSPDFLAVNGSNSPAADINWNKQRIMNAFGFPTGDPHWHWGVERIENNFLFHADKRWTVTVSTSPYSGRVSDLFTASPLEYVKWYNSDLPVTIEVDFGGAQHYFVAFGFSAWDSDHIPKDFKIEIYKTNTSTWETVADVTGNTQWCYLKNYAVNYVGKIKWTITAVNSGDLWLSELIALRPSSKVEDKWPFLPLNATRDINAYMGNNKWLSVATSGIVGLPKQSMCRVYMDNGGANYSVSATTWTKVPFDTKNWDNANEFDTTNNRFTATEDGFYIFMAHIHVASVTDGAIYNLAFYKNGSRNTGIIQFRASGTGDFNIVGTALLVLSAGDYAEVFVYGGSDFQIVNGWTTSLYVAKVA